MVGKLVTAFFFLASTFLFAAHIDASSHEVRLVAEVKI